MDIREDRGWGPYLPGALAGLLIALSALLTGNYFGASTSFVRTAAMVEKMVGPERMDRLEYFTRYAPSVDWQWMFVAGIFIGSFLSAITSGSFKLVSVPDMWRARFGPGIRRRGAVAFVGGAVAMYGARLAGG